MDYYRRPEVADILLSISYDVIQVMKEDSDARRRLLANRAHITPEILDDVLNGIEFYTIDSKDFTQNRERSEYAIREEFHKEDIDNRGIAYTQQSRQGGE